MNRLEISKEVGLIGIIEWYDAMNKREGIIKDNPQVFDMSKWDNSDAIYWTLGKAREEAEWGSSEIGFGCEKIVVPLWNLNGDVR